MSETPADRLREHIETARRNTGLTQKAFAEAIEYWLRGHGIHETVSQPSVSDWEKGSTAPTPAKLQAIAALGGQNADELLRLRAGVVGGDPEPPIDLTRGEFADLPDEDYETIRALAEHLRRQRRKS